MSVFGGGGVHTSTRKSKGYKKRLKGGVNENIVFFFFWGGERNREGGREEVSRGAMGSVGGLRMSERVRE